jgi:hypothetical protein
MVCWSRSERPPTLASAPLHSSTTRYAKSPKSPAPKGSVNLCLRDRGVQFIVYNTSQINLKYLLRVKFHYY